MLEYEVIASQRAHEELEDLAGEVIAALLELPITGVQRGILTAVKYAVLQRHQVEVLCAVPKLFDDICSGLQGARLDPSQRATLKHGYECSVVLADLVCSVTSGEPDTETVAAELQLA